MLPIAAARSARGAALDRAAVAQRPDRAELPMPVPPKALVAPVALPPVIVPLLVSGPIAFALAIPRPPYPSAAREMALPPLIVPLLVRVVIEP